MAKLTAEGKYKYFEDQFDDEEVLQVFRKHPVVMRKGLIVGMGAWLLGPLYTLILTFVYANDPTKFPSITFFVMSFVASVLLGMLVLLPSWIGWYFSLNIVTDQRFIQIHQKGLFNREVKDIALSHIQSMNYKVVGLEQTLLGFGTIVLQTYMGDITVDHVHHPVKVSKLMQNILRDLDVQMQEYGNAGRMQIQDAEA
ncbi:MAG TPA: PH domain-containing protein [Candidatus Saccharimonadales bacterium]|nr:PH domain-containing protein [Candidatus Saccharimonadales bacterium]